jgi:hypothetical protein
LFIFLKQEADTVKTEMDLGVQGEGDFVNMEPYEVYIPSSVDIEKFEPEVSCVFR